MKNKLLIFTVFSAIVLWTALNAGAQTTAFTYQGKLTDSSTTANGSYDFQFILYDAAAAGNLVAANSTATTGVTVSNGTFTVQLDFGAASFSGAARYLEIQVKKPSETNYTTLAPRQPVASAPQSIRSLNAANAANAASLGGVAANQYVLTGDARLSDARNPLAGSSSYIQNTTAQQASTNFSISGDGTAGGVLSGNSVVALTEYDLGRDRVLSGSGFNFFAGRGTGLANTTGTSDAFVGFDAGRFNSSGNNNSFLGTDAGFKNTTGVSNSFFGFEAGFTNVTGNSNTAIGNLADVGSGSLSNATAIGAGAIVSTSNSVVLGRSADTVRIPGNLIVTGSISKGSGSFRIDDPLDPANKYLYHSFVESPDMMNIYNGNATTDGKGEATIVLPDYFEALNRDFRYQLTVIGQFAQAVVAEEIKSNSFKIKTDKPNVKVSWQVTGVRHDKYAEDHPIPNVEEKPAEERGKCAYEAACSNVKLNF